MFDRQGNRKYLNGAERCAFHLAAATEPASGLLPHAV
jgi:hypothetical protein